MAAADTVRALSSERGVSLRYVLRLYNLAVSDGVLEDTTTTGEWAKMTVIPGFAFPDNGHYLSFAEWAVQECGMPLGQPTFHIVHSWSAPAKSLAIGAAKAANWDGPQPERVTQLLEEEWHEQHRPENLEVMFFICPFSVNQHTVSKQDPSDPHAPEPFRDGHPRCEIDKFPDVAQAICGAHPGAQMVLVLDNRRLALKRTFCLEEVHHACMNFADKLSIINALGSIQPEKVDGENAEAYDLDAKTRIDNRIRQTMGGFREFNLAVQQLLDAAIRHGADRFRLRLARPIGRVPPQPDHRPPEGPPFTIWGRIRVNVTWAVMTIAEGVSGVCGAVLAPLQNFCSRISGPGWRVMFGREGSIHLVVCAIFEDRETLHKARIPLEVAQMTGYLQRKLSKTLSKALEVPAIQAKIAACKKHCLVDTDLVEVFPFSLHYKAHPDDVTISSITRSASISVKPQAGDWPDKVVCTVDAESRHLAGRLTEIAQQATSACVEAARTNPAMNVEPIDPFQFGKVHICFVGSTNVGKSSLLNGILCGNADAPFCPTNIMAETVHCTEFSFGPDFKIEGDPEVSKTSFWGRLKKLQKRIMNSEVESSEVKNIKVTIPPAPMFDTDGLAYVVDTPGVTEGSAMAEAVQKRLRSYPEGDLPVLVYCFSLGAGLSTRPGMELSTQDKMFIEASGVPPHRMILVATQYDRFVEEQKGDEEEFVDPYGHEMFAPQMLADEEKISLAQESFAVWCSKVEARYPGITVVPTARVGAKYETALTSACSPKKLVHNVRSAIAKHVSLAHKDMLQTHGRKLSLITSKRMTDATEGSQKQAEEYDSLVQEAVTEANQALDSLADEIASIVAKSKDDLLKQGKYLREKNFFRDLQDVVYDPVMSLIKKRCASACRIAHTKVQTQLNFAIQAVSERHSMSKDRSEDIDGIDHAGSIYPGLVLGGTPVAGAWIACLEGSIAARFATGAAMASGWMIAAAMLSTAVIVVIEANGWSYEGVADKIAGTYTAAAKKVVTSLLSELEQSLKQSVRDAVNIMNFTCSNETARMLTAVQAMVDDADLQSSLRAHVPACD